MRIRESAGDMTLKSYEYEGYVIYFYKTEYVSNHRLAVMALNENDELGFIEPFVNVTVNLPHCRPTNDRCGFVNIETVWDPEGFMKFLEDSNIGTPTGRWEESGYMEFPEYEFNLSKIPTEDELKKMLRDRSLFN